jgi:hypothetical protein
MKNTLKVKLILVMAIFMLVSCTSNNIFGNGKINKLDSSGLYWNREYWIIVIFVVMIKTHTQRVLKPKIGVIL